MYIDFAYNHNTLLFSMFEISDGASERESCCSPLCQDWLGDDFDKIGQYTGQRALPDDFLGCDLKHQPGDV